MPKKTPSIIDAETGARRYQHADEPLHKSKKERQTWKIMEYIPANGHYTRDQRYEVLAAWATCGQFTKVAQEIKDVPYPTMVSWRHQDWWEPALQEFRKLHGAYMDARMTGLLEKKLNAMEDRLDNGDEFVDKDGEIRRKKVTYRDLAIGTGVIYDKRALNRGEPTARVEQISDEDRTRKLIDQFKSVVQNSGRIINVTPEKVENDDESDAE